MTTCPTRRPADASQGGLACRAVRLAWREESELFRSHPAFSLHTTFFNPGPPEGVSGPRFPEEKREAQKAGSLIHGHKAGEGQHEAPTQTWAFSCQ